MYHCKSRAGQCSKCQRQRSRDDAKHYARIKARKVMALVPGEGQDDWLLPDDGIVDEVAVNVAAHGIRKVRLTAKERLLAATEIMFWGGSNLDVITRLQLPVQQDSLVLVS
jgi:hypothetical protein